MRAINTEAVRLRGVFTHPTLDASTQGRRIAILTAAIRRAIVTREKP